MVDKCLLSDNEHAFLHLTRLGHLATPLNRFQAFLAVKGERGTDHFLISPKLNREIKLISKRAQRNDSRRKHSYCHVSLALPQLRLELYLVNRLFME